MSIPFFFIIHYYRTEKMLSVMTYNKGNQDMKISINKNRYICIKYGIKFTFQQDD